MVGTAQESARLREMSERCTSLITLMIDEERTLPGTAERKSLLADMADLRGPMGLGVAELRGFLSLGDPALRDRHRTLFAVATQSLQRISANQSLLTNSQAQALDELQNSFALLQTLCNSLAATSPDQSLTRDPLAQELARFGNAVSGPLNRLLELERGAPGTPERKLLLADMADTRGPFGLGLSALRDYFVSAAPDARLTARIAIGRATAGFTRLAEKQHLLTSEQRPVFEQLSEAWKTFAAAVPALLEQRALADLSGSAINQWLPFVTGLLALAGGFAVAGLAVAGVAPQAVAVTAMLLGIVGALVSILPARREARLRDALARLARGLVPPHLPGSLGLLIDRASALIEASDALIARQDAERQRQVGERRQMLQRLGSEIDQAVSQAVRGLRHNAGELTSSADLMAGLAGDTAQRVDTMGQAVEGAVGRLQAIAAATDQITSSTDEIARLVANSTHVAHEAGTRAHEADGAIRRLSNAAERIGQVMALIRSIAANTNLLALNATIEAARAGEAGKGFAVVASEVKALSNQTAHATQEIDGHIAAMQDATRETMAAIATLRHVVSGIEEMGTGIGGAVEQQVATTHAVADDAQAAAEDSAATAHIAADIRRVATEAAGAAQQVRGASALLDAVAEKLRDDMSSWITRIRVA